jgi:hypothetical protein
MFTVTVLATAQPKPSPKSVTILMAHLAGNSNSPIDCANIVQSLIASFPSDLAMRQRILSFVEGNSLSNVTLAALNGLRRVEHLDPDSLEFIGTCLSGPDAFARADAIDLLANRDSTVRGEFLERLKGIASDPQESKEMRARAQNALEH